ncbi:MAG: hypothetical protein A3C36_02760 [Omnitrophica WOR_2 bacterium RIFCSPHIGHO2_02_FULL_52_10]|nr:MAG: hypothetical protein A3C36_02760 [Omnitrophica WOR_2 bacterium RIFCSPHIGHO2_02_FULL_52_10]
MIGPRFFGRHIGKNSQTGFLVIMLKYGISFGSEPGRRLPAAGPCAREGDTGSILKKSKRCSYDFR